MRLVYEVSVTDAVFSQHLWFVVVGLVVGVGAVLLRRRLGPFALIIGIGWLLIGVGGFGAIYVRDITRAARAVDDLDSRRCTVTSGTVTVLRQQAASGHEAGDEIEVRGRRFTVDYYDDSDGPTYHDTIAHGGVLTDGAHVRITACRGVIARVEVAR